MSESSVQPRGRVLLVDDDKIIRVKGRKLLEAAGCEVHTAESGWAAVTSLDKVNPDLVLLDVTMEPIDGFQTLTLMRQNHRFADTPIFMLSSSDDVFTKGKSIDRGCTDYLEKPLDPVQLESILSQYLDAAAPSNAGHELASAAAD